LLDNNIQSDGNLQQNGKSHGHGAPDYDRIWEFEGEKYRWEPVQWRKMGFLWLTWLSIAVPAIIKDFLTCGTVGYWLLSFASFPPLIFVTWAYGRVLVNQHKDRKPESYAKGDIKWGPREVVRYPLLCSVAGIAAALLGVGGGMVTNPLMLELGVIPEVSRVTSAFMIMFTSSCTSMQYLILGKIEADHAIWYMVWGFVGALLGHYVVEWLLKKYNSTSILVYILAWGVTASAAAMASVDIVDVVQNGFSGFGGVCD